MTSTRDEPGTGDIRLDTARALRQLEEDSYETLDHVRAFRELIDPHWSPENWPDEVATGDDTRWWLRRIDTRLGIIQRAAVFVTERAAGGQLPPGWLIHDNEAAILAATSHDDDGAAEARTHRTGPATACPGDAPSQAP